MDILLIRNTHTTWVGWYQKKRSPTHIHHDHRTFFIYFLHLLRSIAFFFIQFTYLTVFFDNLSPDPLWSSSWSTSYSMHFFTQSSSFRSTCPSHSSLFCCSAVIPMLCHLHLISLSASSLGNLSFSLMPRIHLSHLAILISAR